MVKVEPFGRYHEQEVQQITLQNNRGMVVKCATIGCTITYIGVPDRKGRIENVVCGFNCAELYEQHPQYFGSAIGPFAGRLEQSIIEVDGELFQSKPNEGPHLLHGGSDGFHAQIWSYEVGEAENTQFVRFFLKKRYTNFPGNIVMSIMYTLTDDNELVIDYEGVSDETTLINATNHSYFNLSGNLKRTILDHRLTVSTSQMLYLDEQGVPLGEIKNVIDSPFQFSESIGTIIQQQHTQISRAHGGIDHPFILDNPEIILEESVSGRRLTITTDQKCVVIYTGQKIGNDFSFTEAQAQNYSGICLEVQNMPNSVVHKHFSNSIISPTECYIQTTRYQFSAM